MINARVIGIGSSTTTDDPAHPPPNPTPALEPLDITPPALAPPEALSPLLMLLLEAVRRELGLSG